MRRDYKITCLVASLGLLWVGTSDGIILTYPLPRLRDGVPKINKRPQVSLHGHNGPAKFLVPVHYGPVNGAPLRRKVSSIIRKSDTDAGVLPTTVEVKNEADEVFVDRREKPEGDQNLYESVRMSKGSQHEYECHTNIKLESNSINNGTSQFTIDNEPEKAQASNDIKENTGIVLENVQETSASQVEHGASNQDLQTSGEHTYFVLEPQKDSGDDKNETQDKVQSEEKNLGENIEKHEKVVENGAIPKDSSKQAVQKQLSFNSELAKKVQERKHARELEEQAFDEAEVDDLYGFLKSETKVNTSRTLSAHNSDNSDSEHNRSLHGSLYRRPNFHTSFEAKKPNMSSVKRRSSVRTAKTVEFEEHQNLEVKDKHKIGSSFSGGSSVDTLRKQDTKTMLVVGGGNGYKDWKKRQNYQYRTDEACLVVWMYKV